VRTCGTGINHLDELSVLSNAANRGHQDKRSTVRVMLALVSWFRDVQTVQRRVRLSGVLVLVSNAR